MAEPVLFRVHFVEDGQPLYTDVLAWSPDAARERVKTDERLIQKVKVVREAAR